jgi:phosphatidylglycerol---prolipoprotein diacylglyceryl transferase
VIPLELFPSRSVFLSLGSIQIYWYGIMYCVGFWVAWYFIPILGKMRGIILSRDQWTNIVALGALGALLGGRIGYAFFYEPTYFLESPGELFRIWNGGMSSHGGFIGTALGVWFAVKERTMVRLVADSITVPAAIGLALGRIGNILNEEFGVYPYYEAFGNIAIAMICYVMIRKGSSSPFPIFLLLYSVQRFFLEYLRPQDFPPLFGLSRGQLLTIPLFILAVLLLKNARKSRIYGAI